MSVSLDPVRSVIQSDAVKQPEPSCICGSLQTHMSTDLLQRSQSLSLHPTRSLAQPSLVVAVASLSALQLTFLSVMNRLFHIFLQFCILSLAMSLNSPVRVETLSPGTGDSVTRDHRYTSMVTLYIENTADGTRTPSGWSTREADGADADKPFKFQPGVQLIKGWTEGVLQMREGERALLHVPSDLGYGSRPMGAPGGAFYIPANSDLLFDIEILGKEGSVKVGDDL